MDRRREQLAMENQMGTAAVSDEELRLVRGGASFWGKVWGKVKKAAKWAKDHIFVGRRKAGFKGKF